MTKPSPQRKGRLKNGAEPHILTAEERRKGAATTNAIKREAAKSVRQRFAEKVEAEADELYQAFKKAWTGGDWKAAQAMLHEAFGRPTERVEVTGADGGPVAVEDRSASLQDVARVLIDTGALPE